MTPKEKIAKLEGLLVRIKERAEAPRPRGAAAIPAPVAPSAPVMTAPAPAVAASAPAVAAAEPAVALPPPVAQTLATAPPPSDGSWSEPPDGPDVADSTIVNGELDLDVEVSAEVVEVDIDIDEPGMELGLAESGAQPIAEAVRPAESSDAELEVSEVEVPEGLLAEDAPAPPTSVDPGPPANELVEPAPTSSPRPISSETPEAYEGESAPRHTPPPESGKQVAAPSVKPEPERPVSVPPDSAGDGRTLIGVAFARSPVLGSPRGPGVRVPAPTAGVAPPAVPQPPVEEPRAAIEAPEPARLEPAVTRAELKDAPVATFEGTRPAFTPATFGDLLEATLRL